MELKPTCPIAHLNPKFQEKLKIVFFESKTQKIIQIEKHFPTFCKHLAGFLAGALEITFLNVKKLHFPLHSRNVPKLHYNCFFEIYSDITLLINFFQDG